MTAVIHLKVKDATLPDDSAPLVHVASVPVPDGATVDDVWDEAADAIHKRLREKWPQPGQVQTGPVPT